VPTGAEAGDPGRDRRSRRVAWRSSRPVVDGRPSPRPRRGPPTAPVSWTRPGPSDRCV